jgi:glycerol-3-phosphate acyltransferase PlsY
MITNWNLYLFLVEKFSLEGSTAVLFIQLAGVLLSMIIPYLLGSINPAIIFSRLFFKDDIREHGSGNAGTTNTLRTYGKRMAALILVLDFLKAIMAVVIGYFILPYQLGGGSIAGIFVILGHSFPIYYGFRGGKGVACLAGVVLMLSPISFAILIAVFIAIVAMTKYVSLASIMGVMLLPVVHFAFYPTHAWTTIASIVIMLIIVFMHRENIKRLLSRTENKIGQKAKKN